MKFEKYSENEALEEAQRLKERTGKTNPTFLELDSAQKIIDKENVEKKWYITLRDCMEVYCILSELSTETVILPEGMNREKLKNTTGEELFDYAKRVLDNEEFWSKLPEAQSLRYSNKLNDFIKNALNEDIQHAELLAQYSKWLTTE